MDYQQKRVLFFCYLFISSMCFSMAQKAMEVTDQQANEIADDFLAQFQNELDVYEQKAPADPDNDIENEDRGRAFFLLPFLPKLAILLVKVAIKLAPLVIKAAVALKAKAVAVAAVGLAKVSSAAALKATAITVGKKILIDVAASAVIDVVTDKVTDLVAGPEPQPAPEEEEVTQKPKKPLNLFDFYETGSEICTCNKKVHCSCCVHPPEFEPGCFNLTLTKTLWDPKASIKVGAFYGGKEIMTRNLKVGHPGQKCHKLSEPFNTVNMCFSTYGRTFRGKRVIQCFSLYFNHRGLSKCIVQNDKNKLWFKKGD